MAFFLQEIMPALDLFEYTNYQIVILFLIFLGTAFVRSSFGFGAAALGFPLLLLFVENNLLLWLPMLGLHMLFFSTFTITKNVKNVDWINWRKALLILIPPFSVGIFGLINFSAEVLGTIVYLTSILFGVMWLFDLKIASKSRLLDFCLMMVGGYISGNSLNGSPLVVVVMMRHIEPKMLRKTLFALWFVFVSAKLFILFLLGINLQFASALLLLPVAIVGHFVGAKLHYHMLLQRKKILPFFGFGLCLISIVGLFQIYAK